ncbi:hypothetical protein ACFW6E_00040 [Streptomyces olivaceoviridis]|uniref:hypothetical protein n=1 Tax=Streptomyces olivaceoviridis TaxID=1921 RepID=UPI00368D004C
MTLYADRGYDPTATARDRTFLAQYAEDRPLLGDSVENWLHPLAAMSAYTLTRLRQPTPRDLLDIDLDHLSDDLMSRMTGTLDRAELQGRPAPQQGWWSRPHRPYRRFHAEIRQAVVSHNRYHIEG